MLAKTQISLIVTWVALWPIAIALLIIGNLAQEPPVAIQAAVWLVIIAQVAVIPLTYAILAAEEDYQAKRGHQPE